MVKSFKRFNMENWIGLIWDGLNDVLLKRWENMAIVVKSNVEVNVIKTLKM